MKIKGVDLSYCQEGISFPALKQAGVRFAIIRAGFSIKKDVTMDKFVADCKKHSIDYGFYWYSYAMSIEQAEAEAKKCISVIKELSPDISRILRHGGGKADRRFKHGHTHKDGYCFLRKDKAGGIQARSLCKSVLYGELL